jgi:hypothetical protein
VCGFQWAGVSQTQSDFVTTHAHLNGVFYTFAPLGAGRSVLLLAAVSLVACLTPSEQQLYALNMSAAMRVCHPPRLGFQVSILFYFY